MLEIQVRNAEKVLKAAEQIPSTLTWTLRRAFDRALTKYKVEHQAAKMKAPAPPTWKSRSPVEAGVLGTRQHAGKTGFLSLFRVSVIGDRLSNMVGKLATRGGMIAYRQEFGGSWAPGRIPFPPAKDVRGRTTEKAKRLWKQGKLIRIPIKGKDFFFAVNPQYKKQRRRGGITLGQLLTKGPALQRKSGRLIPMFHVSAHRLKPRLSFYRLWKAFYPQARALFVEALRFAVTRARRGG